MTIRAAGSAVPPSAESIVDALLPNRSDPPLEELANATFIDGQVDVAVSPVDQMLMALTRRLLLDPALGRVAVVQLPRAKHRVALLLAIMSHLLCRQPPADLGGPVVLVGFDVDLVSQLRSLAVRNRRRMGLADGNPLSAHRLTRAGSAEPLIGSEARPVDRSLLYYNTRIGQPSITCSPPLVVVDATSVENPVARTRALEWALQQGAAAIAVIGDLGDDGLVKTVSDAGLVPLVLAVTQPLAQDLVATFNRGVCPPSTLSSQSILWLSPTSVSLHRVVGEAANDAVSRALEAIAAKPNGPPPPQLDVPLKLVRNGSRLAARVADYKTACTYNPRPGEFPALRLLDRATATLPPNWRSWETANLGALKAAARALWRALEEDNPKLLALWRVLDQLERTTSGTILIRCHSRAAAEATRTSLSTGERTEAQIALWDRIEARVRIGTFKERVAAGDVDAQVLTSPPPPWLFSLLLGIEAPTTHVLVYAAEEAILARQGERWAATASGWDRALARVLNAPAPDALVSPVAASGEAAPARAVATLQVPGLSLAQVLDSATDALDPPDEVEQPVSTTTLSGGASARMCVPVHLADGRTWWCIDDGDGATPVVRVTAGGPEHCPVAQLQDGDSIVVPAGEGTDSIHARLVAASRSNADVQSLDLILSQLRAAARAVIASSRTQREAVKRVANVGAEAPSQLGASANGTTIAPREPEDVRAVFRAAHRPCPDLNLIYAVADALRSLNRTLGRFVAAVAGGRGDDTVARLRDLVGPVADELLDEFVISTVTGVDEAREIPAYIAGRVR